MERALLAFLSCSFPKHIGRSDEGGGNAAEEVSLKDQHLDDVSQQQLLVSSLEILSQRFPMLVKVFPLVLKELYLQDYLEGISFIQIQCR